MEYKKHYTDEEINDTIEWFKSHMDELPTSLQLDKATFVADLRKTVPLYFDIAAKHKDNPTYSAQLRHLFLMREAVEQTLGK